VVGTPIPVALAVAAHDPLGGAGLAADLTTFAALGVHGTLAITAVTAQHLDRVDRVEPVGPELLAGQLDGVEATWSLDAVKTGLLGSAQAVRLVAQRVVSGQLPAPVVDPVLVDGRGEPLGSQELRQAYREELLPLARVVTPNLAELSVLLASPVASVAEIPERIDEIVNLGAEVVVVTGGSEPGGPAVDAAVFADGSCEWLEAAWVDTAHVRGSGCTFAAAIAAELARGRTVSEALVTAKRFVSQRLALADWPGLDGVGPVPHWLG